MFFQKVRPAARTVCPTLGKQEKQEGQNDKTQASTVASHPSYPSPIITHHPITLQTEKRKKKRGEPKTSHLTLPPGVLKPTAFRNPFPPLLMSSRSAEMLTICDEKSKNVDFIICNTVLARDSLVCRRTKKRKHRMHRSMDAVFSKTVPTIFILLITFIVSIQGLSSSPSNDNKPPPPSYKSRSTSIPDEASNFAEGSDARRGRLHEALSTFGIEASVLTDSAEFRGSAALRAYSSFILPKSAGALAVADSPQRAAVVANNIAFLIREHKSHQEEWLRNHDRSIAEAEEILDGTPRQPLTLVLDNVRSAHNVGNILRAAEAARVSNVVLCGITPGPPNSKVLKTAVGSAEYVPHAHFGSTLDAVQDLQRQGVTVWACETTSKSQPMWKTEMPQPLALVFGNEVVGVEADVLEQCDGLVCIPTHGVKNSLNVATCASVVMWEALRQWDSRRSTESS